MSLEGIRAWIGEVERKLRVRTKVFLALAVIAIGIAGAAVYLAIDTRADAVSESDVQELQRELEARMGVAGAVDTTQTDALQAEVEALREEVEQLQGGNGGGGSNNGGGGGNGQSRDGGATAPGGIPTLPTIPDPTE